MSSGNLVSDEILNQIVDLCKRSNIKIGAQDIDFSQGARTGSISAKACKDLGCNWKKNYFHGSTRGSGQKRSPSSNSSRILI